MNPSNQDFAEADRHAASNMVEAVRKARLARIIYLGGLGLNDENLSKHLRSRSEVAAILHSGAVPVTELRAAMIIGSGSASFEILRYLVDRLPVMVTPRWVNTPSQPIAIRNVLNYLVGCLVNESTTGKIYDIGGPTILTYRQLMEIYAEEAGLPRRLIVPVPVLTPRLSSYWIHLVTPVPASVARPLAEGLRNPMICANSGIEQLIPQVLLNPREAIRLALDHTRLQTVESHWIDAGQVAPGDPDWAGGAVYSDKRSILIQAEPEIVWKAVSSIGGSTGWLYANWLWNLRGLLDRIAGGVGLRRGRRHPTDLKPGDALDFWRVVEVKPGKRLVLQAEMKLPGIAVLDFHIKELQKGTTELKQVAWYKPKGLFGNLYWYCVLPFHHFVFQGMLKGIAAKCQNIPADEEPLEK